MALTARAEKRLLLFSGRANPELAEEIAKELGTPLGEVDISDFANGEIYVRFLENVRGSDAFVIQSHSDPINSRIMEQLIMIDALKRASAKRITAVAPFYGYARQDKKTLGREPITAKLVADLFTAAGADRLISVDLHTGQIQGFFDTPVDHLTALPVIATYLASAVDGRVVVVSPDAGRVKVAEKYARHLGADLAILYKRRPADRHNVAEVREVVGEVKGRVCVIVDDMIDTAGTVVGGAEILLERGAREVYAAATHPVLSGPAVERLARCPIKEVVVTNTLPIPPEKRIPKLTVLSIAPLLARAIAAVFQDRSVSEIFRGENA